MDSRAALFHKVAYSYYSAEDWRHKEPVDTDDGYPQRIMLVDGSEHEAVYAGGSGHGCWIDTETAQPLRPIAWRDNELSRGYRERKGLEHGYI